MYTGHLYDWKGSDILLEAAREFESKNSESESLFVFVGGTKKDIEIFKSKAESVKLSNIKILGISRITIFRIILRRSMFLFCQTGAIMIFLVDTLRQ